MLALQARRLPINRPGWPNRFGRTAPDHLAAAQRRLARLSLDFALESIELN
jgi:hypothetical protein